MSKHTPSPWAVTCERNRDGAYNDIGAPESEWPANQIALVSCNNPQYAANCRLIAAAPELLRALIDLGDWLAYGLNKADGAEPTAEDHAACERVTAQARAAIDKATT